MELVEKILVVEVEEEGKKKTLRRWPLDGKDFCLRAGPHPSCDIRTDALEGRSPFDLVVKEGEEIFLHVTPSMKGELWFANKSHRIGDLMEQKLLPFRKGRYTLELLKDYDCVRISIGATSVKIAFEKVAPAHDIKIPTRYPGPFALVRFRSWGKLLYRCLVISAIIHIAPLILVLSIPRLDIAGYVEPVYRRARAVLTPVKKKDSEAAEVGKLTGQDKSTTLIAMMDSNRMVQGFVRNLFFSGADSFEIPTADKGAGKATGGLFVNIERSQEKIKREELKEIGPLFAATESKSRIARDTASPVFAEPELKTEDVTIEEGSIDRESIAKIIRNGEGALRLCYEEALLRKSELSVSLVLSFKIAETGAVESVDIESTSLKDKPFEDCILRKAKGWQFPRTEGGRASIKQPFVFYTSRKG